MPATLSAFGPWLAYVMGERSATSQQLANMSGVPEQLINDLIAGKTSADQHPNEVRLIGEALLTNDAIKQMDKVLEALKVHHDLRAWRSQSSGCDGGCCPWNALIA